MTFQDIAQQACDIVGENDSNTLTFAKNRVKDSYRIFWNSYEWPETITYQTIAVPASTLGSIYGPGSIFTDSSYGEIYSASWVPAGAGSQSATGTFTSGNATVSVSNTGTLAAGMQVYLNGVIQSGTTILSVTVNTSITLSSTALQSGSFTFTAFALPVLNPIPSSYRDRNWVIENAPAFITPNITSVLPHFYWKEASRGVPFDPLTLPNPISFKCFASAENCNITIHGKAIEPTSGLSVEVSEQLVISTSSPNAVVLPSHNFTSIYSISKTAGAGYILVQVNNAASQAYVMQPLDGKYEFNQYFFIPSPTTPWYWNLQFKLRPPEFSSLLDTDGPAIQHMEDALLAMTQHYLLQRQKQYNKAQQMIQIANTFLQGAKDITRNQEREMEQIIPDIYDVTNLNGWRTRRRTSSFF